MDGTLCAIRASPRMGARLWEPGPAAQVGGLVGYDQPCQGRDWTQTCQLPPRWGSKTTFEAIFPRAGALGSRNHAPVALDCSAGLRSFRSTLCLTC